MYPRVSLPKAFMAASAVLVATAPGARAQTVWAGALTGSNLAWNTGSNWTGGVVPSGTTAAADLRLDWTGTVSLSLGSAITLNTLSFDDTGAADDVGLTLGNGGTAGNTLTFAGTSRTLTVAGSTLTIGANLAGSFSKAGLGTLVLSGDNTALTALTINRNSGVVRVTSAAALGGASTTVTLLKEQSNESGQLQLATTGTHTFGQTWGSFKSAGTLGSGSSAHIRNNSGNNTITGNLNLGSTGGSGIVIESAGTAAGDLLTLAGNLTSSVQSSRTHSIGGAGNGVISGIISNNSSTNTLSLEKSGAGTWTLTGANTFTGAVGLQAGTLAIGDGGTTGTLGAGTNTVNFTAGATLQFNLAADRTHSGALNGAGNLVKLGSGTLTLTGTGRLAGGTVIVRAGTLRLGAAANTLADTVSLSIDGAGTLDLAGSTQSISTLASANLGNHSLVVTGGAGSALSLVTSTTNSNVQIGPGGTVTSAHRVTLDLSDIGSFTYANSASGSVFRVGPKSGAGNSGGLGDVALLRLAGVNSITATTFAVADQFLNTDAGRAVVELGAANTLNADTFNLGNGNRADMAMGFRSGLVDPTLVIRGSDGSSAATLMHIGKAVTFSGAGQTAFLADVDLSPGIVDARVTTLLLGTAEVGTQTGRAGTMVANLSMGRGTLTVGEMVLGRFSSAAGSSIGANMSGTGNFTLSHAEGTLEATTLTFSSVTNLATGAFTRTANGTLNLVAGTVRATTIARHSGATESDRSTLNWTSGTIGNRAGSDLSIGAGFAINLLDGEHSFDATGSNSITVASAITGGFGLAKTGTGSLVLQAANTYTGPTTVSQGDLVLGAGGSLADNAVVNLAEGARFATVGGAAWSSGSLRPGGLGSIAAAEIGDLILGGGTLAFDLSAPGTGDRLVLATGATLTLNSGAIAINPLLGSLANGDYDLIDHSAGTLDGILAENPSGLSLVGISASGSRQATELVDTGSVLRLSVTGSAASLTWVGSSDIAYPNAWRIHDPISELPNWTANGAVEAGTLDNEFYQGDAVAFAGAGAGTVEVDDALVAGAVAISGSSDYTFAGVGSLAAASLSKAGTGRAAFGVALSTVGGATLSAGELELSSAEANATDISVSGGTLRLSGGSVGAVNLSAGTVILSGAGSPAALVATGGLIEVDAASSLGSATVSLTDATLRLASLGGLGSGAASLSGSRLEVAGSGAFEKAFVGFAQSTLALTGAGSAVTRAAALLPESGTLTLEVAEADASLLLSAAHTGSGDLALTKTGAGTLKLTAANTLASVTVAAGALQLGDNTAAGSVNAPVSVAEGAWLRFHSSGSPSSQSAGVISGQGNVEWVGNNTGELNSASSYTLGTANAHSGLTRLSGARANVSNAAAFGTSRVEVAAGAQILYVATTAPLSNEVRLVSATSWGDSASIGTFGSLRLGSNAMMTGNLILAADGLRISGNNSVYAGVISEEGGSRGLEINNPTFSLNTVTLSGANTFSGPVTVNRNTLSVASLNSVVGGAASSNLGAPLTAEAGIITIGSAASGADLTYTGPGETTDRIIRIGAGTGSSTLNASGTGLLRLTSAFVSAPGANRSLGLGGTGVGQVDAPLSGAEGFTLALTKSGAGTWTLLGANTLAGVTVSGGTLNLSGDNTLDSLTQSGASTVTTLSGENTFSGNVTIDAGTLVLGSAGALQGATSLGVRLATVRSSDATARTIEALILFNDHATFGSADTGNLLFTGNVGLGSIVKNLTIANAVTEFSGILSRSSGTATTLKLGEGKMILSGANTYTGTLEVRAGAVELAGAGKLGATSSGLTLSGGSLDLGGTSQSVGAVIISAAAASGDTLANGSLTGSSYAVSNASGTATVSANLGAGTLTKTGNGVLVLSGANALTGLTIANSGGTLRVTDVAALGTGTISLSKAGANSGTLELALTGANTIANPWGNFNSSSSTVASTPGVATLRNVSGDNTVTGLLSLTGTGGNGINIESAGTAPGDRLVLAGGIGSTVDSGRGQTLHGAGIGLVSGDITNVGTGPVTLNKDGVGTWTLSGNNSHRGPTLVYQGTLVAASSSALGTTDSGSEVRSGATLALLGSLDIGAETLLLRGTGAGGAGALRSSGGNSTYAGAVTLGAASSVHVEDDSLVLSGAIGGNFALTKQGAGVLLLSGANTHGGLTQITAGVLRLGHASALGATTSGTSVAAGASLELDGGLSVLGEALTLAGSGVASGGALRSLSGDNNWSGNLTLGAAASIVADAGTLTLSGAVSGNQNLALGGAGDIVLSGILGISAGTVTKSGAGTLTLSGDNTFSGGLSLEAGNLVLGSARALGTGSVTVASGATLSLGGYAPANTLSLLAGGTLALGAADFSGTVAFAPGAAVTGAGVLGLYGDVDLAGVTLASGISLSLLGGGNVNLGDLAYAEDIAYVAGSFAAGNFTGNLVVAGEARILGPGIAAGTIKLTAGNSAVLAAGFDRPVLFEGGVLTGLDSSGYAGLITVGGNAVLDVDQGEETAATAARYRVLAGSTLKGSAVFAGAVSVEGTLAPGNSPGVMEFSDGLSLDAASVTEWEFDSAIDIIGVVPGDNTDLLVVSGGAFTLAAGATLKVIAPGDVDYTSEAWDLVREFTVVSVIGTGTHAPVVGFSLDTSSAGLFSEHGGWSLFQDASGIDLIWTPAAIPEPSTYGLILGGLALAGAAVRRRRAKAS